MTPESLGFTEINDLEWRKAVRGREVTFRSLIDFDDFGPVETLQRDVMGATDLDVFGSTGLVSVPETGGHVLAAYIDGELAGAVYGFGGYHNGTPRHRRPTGWACRRIPAQPGSARNSRNCRPPLHSQPDFREIVWTVDPLRAANARLNSNDSAHGRTIMRRTATARRTAARLYGGLPTDRLHMTWSIADPEVAARLMGEIPPRSAEDVPSWSHSVPGGPRIAP